MYEIHTYYKSLAQTNTHTAAAAAMNTAQQGMCEGCVFIYFCMSGKWNAHVLWKVQTIVQLIYKYIYKYI